ncbi:uncharacterized protein TNCV_4482851 [Trichonephila clavipes]|nr:uncharacterized protein TNCV_4482851 [Trichonephila clavipes]
MFSCSRTFGNGPRNFESWMRMTLELAPPLLTTTREDVRALDRFSVHHSPTRWVFSSNGLEHVTCLPRSDTSTTRLLWRQCENRRHTWHVIMRHVKDPLSIDLGLWVLACRGCGSPVVKVSDHGRHVMSSSPVPLISLRFGQRCSLNLSRAETSSRWCGGVVTRSGASSGVVPVT